MMNLINKKKAEEGFTLIELMIVVAIIGILAAIAIPQFAAYRIRAFNGATTSDVRNARLAEEALFADYQQYGATRITAGTAGTGTGTNILTNGSAFLVTATANNAIPVTLSSGVQMNSVTTVVSAQIVSALVWGKHTQADKIMGFDTDFTSMYWTANTTNWPGTALSGNPTGFVTPTSTTGITNEDLSGWSTL